MFGSSDAAGTTINAASKAAVYPKVAGCQALVTGGSGFVGQRLVEMLLERGARRVVSFDIAPKPKDALDSPHVQYVQGDLTAYDSLAAAGAGCDIVYHIAALVGPYHPKQAYRKVNYEGTLNVLKVCAAHNIKRIVMSSSPSTRFPYPDPNVAGLREDQLFEINGGDFAPVFLQPYAETKALGEKAVRDACGVAEGDLLTVAVAPHQVYGPRDVLTLPSLLETAGSGKLRVFGDGENMISWCHVDNYCHGLILGAEALYPGSPALGKYYVVRFPRVAFLFSFGPLRTPFKNLPPPPPPAPGHGRHTAVLLESAGPFRRGHGLRQPLFQGQDPHVAHPGRRVPGCFPGQRVFRGVRRAAARGEFPHEAQPVRCQDAHDQPVL